MSAPEYKGHDGLVRVEGDELVWRKGMRLTRAVGAGGEWRVPLPCIREVVFKDSGLTAGHLHLVIGDAEAPTNKQWNVIGHQWTITFQPGKQAKAFRELHEIVSRAVALNRQTGVDPTKTRLPYIVGDAGDETSAYAVQELVRQPSPDTTVAEMITLAKGRPKAFSEAWPSLDSLPSRLEPGESIRLLASAGVTTGIGVLVLTDRRVLLHRRDELASRHDEIPLASLESAGWKSGVLGGLVLRSGVHKITAGVHESTAQVFIEAVRPSASTTGADVMEQLRKLGELRDGGVLTDEEFQTKKAQLLDRL